MTSSNTEWVMNQSTGRSIRWHTEQNWGKNVSVWLFLLLSFIRFLLNSMAPVLTSGTHWPPGRRHVTNHNPFSLAAQLSTHLTVLSSSLYFISLSMGMLQEISPKSLSKVEINIIISFLIIHLIHRASYLTAEDSWVGQAWYFLHINMLTSPSHLPLYLETGSRIICFITFPEIKVRTLTSL